MVTYRLPFAIAHSAEYLVAYDRSFEGAIDESSKTRRLMYPNAKIIPKTKVTDSEPTCDVG